MREGGLGCLLSRPNDSKLYLCISMPYRKNIIGINTIHVIGHPSLSEAYSRCVQMINSGLWRTIDCQAAYKFVCERLSGEYQNR